MNVDTQSLAAGVLAGDRKSLAKAITLVEATDPKSRAQAETLLSEVTPPTLARQTKARRIGITGAPGVGKSTFINNYGLTLVDANMRLAVLAIDPTSRVSGGSIMGDKTRMAGLSAVSEVFIRPSPSGNAAGGIASQTHETVTLCEAAGFDVVIVETVGVGQAELAVADVTDLFVLLIAPAGGDELQGIKRGIVELADVILVTKADGDLATQASNTAGQYRQALELARPKYSGTKDSVDYKVQPVTLATSSFDAKQLAAAAKQLDEAYTQLERCGLISQIRSRQMRRLLDNELLARAFEMVSNNPGFADAIEQSRSRVLSGKVPISQAARELIALTMGVGLK